MSFLNKVVIVTGSSSGIGAATAIEFSKEGAHVVLVGRNKEKLKNIRDQCVNVGKEPLVLVADVTKEDEAKSVIDKTITTYGKLDVLVNNAGTTREVDILNKNFMEAYDLVININLRAVVFLTHLAIPHLIDTKGNIVNISSSYAKICVPKTIPYCTSKAGLNYFTRCVAARLAPLNVRVNIVSPGPTRTDIIENSGRKNLTWDMIGETTPLKRVSEPKEIAETVLFLASEKAKSITGADYAVDNGTTL
ncbi:3-oxoacyl-[acyl-carrier-protein] reductase FabG-like [Battus philenor]|uniref:3-oxoacyl-[acyl-carrier-protein] reductase FabG-like n=1 Tax=Battus philenor TaxID=42288 RepID=UPI0035CF51FA